MAFVVQDVASCSDAVGRIPERIIGIPVRISRQDMAERIILIRCECPSCLFINVVFQVVTHTVRTGNGSIPSASAVQQKQCFRNTCRGFLDRNGTGSRGCVLRVQAEAVPSAGNHFAGRILDLVILLTGTNTDTVFGKFRRIQRVIQLRACELARVLIRILRCAEQV